MMQLLQRATTALMVLLVHQNDGKPGIERLANLRRQLSAFLPNERLLV